MVLAERGRRAVVADRGCGESREGTRDLVSVDIDPEAPREELRIGQEIRRQVDRRDQPFLFDGLLLDLGLRHGLQEREELIDRAVAVGDAERSLLDLLDPGHPVELHEIRVEAPLLTDPFHRIAEAERALGGQDEHHRDVAVLAGLDRGQVEPRDDHHRAAALRAVVARLRRILPDGREVRHVHQAPQHRGLDRRVEMLPDAGAMARVERHQDVCRRLGRAEVRRLRETDWHRRPIPFARHVEESARGGQREIRRWMSGVGSGLAEGRDRDVEEHRIARAQGGGAETHRVHHAGGERLDQDVRGVDERKQLLAV